MKQVQELYITFVMKPVRLRAKRKFFQFISNIILGKLFSYVFGDTSCQARMETSDPKPLKYISLILFVDLKRDTNDFSEPIARSVSDETEGTVEQIPRESQITPPQTPSTTVRESQETCSFFGRRRRHRHHSHRSRRYEVVQFTFSFFSILYSFFFLSPD